MKLGKIKFYHEKKAYGFIEQAGEEEDIFFHISGVTPGLIPVKDMSVTYDIGQGKKGPQAVEVSMGMSH